MKPIWVIENYSLDNSQQEIAEEVTKQGYRCHLIKSLALVEDIPERICQDNECVIFHGTIQTAEKVQLMKPQWLPGAIATFSNYNCDKYYPIVKDYLLNKDHEFFAVRDLSDAKWDFYRKFGKEGAVWIRPNSSKKPFTAGLVIIEEFDRFLEEDIKPNCHPENYIVVSSPKVINSEFRFIGSPDGIVAQSCYMYQENRMYIPSAPAKATELCLELLRLDFKPDYFFAIDICEDKEGRFHLLEYNAFSTSGLYACNKEHIVRRISNYAEWNYGSDAL